MNKVARDHGDAIAPMIPSGRIGTPEAMAGAAIYLASRAGEIESAGRFKPRRIRQSPLFYQENQGLSKSA